MRDPLLSGRYRLGPRLGQGGMGVVRAAVDVTTGRDVAVKTLLIESNSRRESLLRRFDREVALVSRIQSRHVVALLDHGVMGSGDPFLVMERLHGSDLGSLLDKRGRLEPAEVLAIVSQVAEALGAAHAIGIIHRDVKPSNVFLTDTPEGTVIKLLDFGVAKDTEALSESNTTTGAAVGTPHYMSPEQIVGKPLDFRSDLFSLGVLVFRALAGVKPFDGDSIGALVLALYGATFPSLRAARPDLPEPMEAWFARACAREPADRFASAEELADGLARALGLRRDVSVRIPLPPGPPAQDESESLASTMAASGQEGPRSPLSASVSVQPTLAAPASQRAKSPLRTIAIGGAVLAIAVGVAAVVRPGAPGGGSSSTAGGEPSSVAPMPSFAPFAIGSSPAQSAPPAPSPATDTASTAPASASAAPPRMRGVPRPIPSAPTAPPRAEHPIVDAGPPSPARPPPVEATDQFR